MFIKTIKCNTKNLTSIIKVLISTNVCKQFAATKAATNILRKLLYLYFNQMKLNGLIALIVLALCQKK